jgi:hypothetical protein
MLVDAGLMEQRDTYFNLFNMTGKMLNQSGLSIFELIPERCYERIKNEIDIVKKKFRLLLLSKLLGFL